MRITLTYEGPLHAASGGNTRNTEKHLIRRHFHRQLADVFSAAPMVDSLNRWKAAQLSIEAFSDRERSGESLGLFTREVGAYHCMPLISRRKYAICELDILFLRRESAGNIVNGGGDLDNRLKVLFDALRMPQNSTELPNQAIPEVGENPLFCMLEDDQLITSFRIKSERLLGTRDDGQSSPADVKLVIEAAIKLTRLTYGNIGLGDMS